MNAYSIISDAVSRERPHPQLQPFISHYVFQNMHIPEGKYFEKN